MRPPINKARRVSEGARSGGCRTPKDSGLAYASGSDRRGFTILETVLAASLAAVIAAIALGMFLGMERTDRSLAVRAEQSSDLARSRLVMQRTFLSLLMTNSRPPQRRPAGEAPRSGDDPATPATPAPPERELTPRLFLDADPRFAGMTMSRREDSRTYGVQRLELVLTDAPVPDSTRDIWEWVERAPSLRDRAAASTDPAADPQPVTEGDADPEEAQAPVRAVRGAFEFRPQERRSEQGRLEAMETRRGATPESPALWELWWVPLAPKGEYTDDPPPPLPLLGEPYRVASNLRYARWTLYDDREKKVRHSAALRQHLPAYAELTLETGAGLAAEFMFEVDSAQGPESAVAAASRSPGSNIARPTPLRPINPGQSGGALGNTPPPPGSGKDPGKGGGKGGGRDGRRPQKPGGGK